MTITSTVRLTEKVRRFVEREGPVRASNVADTFRVSYDEAKTKLRTLDHRGVVHVTPDGFVATEGSA